MEPARPSANHGPVRIESGYMEPTRIEPVTSCLQSDPEDVWKEADLEGLYW